MIDSTLEQIKRLRKKYHLNQKELADKAGVSQSLIAKIEAGKLDPSYTKAQQIFQALEQLREKEEIKAHQIMNSKIIFAQSSDHLKDIIKIMKQKGISQVPVMQKEKVCGIISESAILQKIADHPETVSSLKAGEVMDDVPPIVSLQTGLKTLLQLLQDNQIVLVAEKGDVKGIISKSDVLGKME
ncbi:CBS domain-containing protein [Candidatus Woesearchaeota archaeon]|nr:CBS domain-containing protein [Candidatus Woesearchaeota archaeon]